jgi:hypothetical protein
MLASAQASGPCEVEMCMRFSGFSVANATSDAALNDKCAFAAIA